MLLAAVLLLPEPRASVAFDASTHVRAVGGLRANKVSRATFKWSRRQAHAGDVDVPRLLPKSYTGTSRCRSSSSTRAGA